jgi:hypothetical protein
MHRCQVCCLLLYKKDASRQVKLRLGMSKEKLKLTRKQFILILASALLVILLVLLVILTVFGGVKLLKAAGLVLAVVVAVAIGAAIPFFLGVILQAVFRKKIIPPCVPWAVAFLIVFVPWLLKRRTLREFLGQDIFGLGLSIFIFGLFMDAGIKSFRTFREKRQSAKRIST